MNNILLVTLGMQGPIKGGGISTAFFNLAKHLVNQNKINQVDVLYCLHPYYQDKLKRENHWKKEFKNLGINFIPLTGEDMEIYGSIEMKRSYLVQLFLKENEGKYNKVVFHDFKGMGYYPLQSKALGIDFQNIDFIISSHGNTRLSDQFNRRYPKKSDDLITYFLEQKTLELADLVISPSQYYLDWYKNENYTLPTTKVVQNLLVLNESIVNLPSHNINSDTFHFCFFARVEPLKGIFIFLDAIKDLLETTNHKIKVSIIGNPTEVSDQNVADIIKPVLDSFKCSVKWHKSLDSYKALTYIKSNNGIIINPTLGENSPYSVMEAIEYKIPFFASDIPGILELVEEDYHNKIIFETGSTSSLIQLLKNYCNTPFEITPQLRIKQATTRESWTEILSTEYNILPNNDFTSGHKATASDSVSVIIPTTGDRPVLKETLLGFYNSEVWPSEILVGIDGNNPNLVHQIINELDEKFKLLLSVHQFNKIYKPGVSNKLADIAKGEYLLFFDDDDIPFSNMLTKYLFVLNKNRDIDLLSDFAQNFILSEDGKNVPWESSPVELANISLALGNAKSVNALLNHFGKANFIVKKTVYLQVGGFTATQELSPYVDWDFYTKCSASGYRIEVIPEPLYYYRMHSHQSIFYQSHNSNNFESITKRFSGHKKITDSIMMSSSIDDYKDYFTYTRSLLAAPQVYIDTSKTNGPISQRHNSIYKLTKDISTAIYGKFLRKLRLSPKIYLNPLLSQGHSSSNLVDVNLKTLLTNYTTIIVKKGSKKASERVKSRL